MIQTQTADIFQERQTDKVEARRKEIHTERPKGRQTDRQRSIKGDRQTYRQKTEKQANGQVWIIKRDIKIDRHMDEQTYS